LLVRLKDLDIVIVPGWSGSGPDHWQSRWAAQLSTSRVIEQDDWIEADKARWTDSLVEKIKLTPGPSLIVAHSLGVITTVHALHDERAAGQVHGAFLVAPADLDHAADWPITKGKTFSECGAGFMPIPMEKLPVPSVVIGSENDPYCSHQRAAGLAEAWGSAFVSAGEAGHINVDSGHGPWPEGLMRLGWFLKQIALGTAGRT